MSCYPLVLHPDVGVELNEAGGLFVGQGPAVVLRIVNALSIEDTPIPASGKWSLKRSHSLGQVDENVLVAVWAADTT
jgi:hypothetical protein